METVAANPVLFVILVRQAVEKSVSGQGLVKRGVEDRDLGSPGEETQGLPDPDQVDRVVEGSQPGKFLDFLNNFIGDNSWVSEDVSTVGDAVSHRGDFIRGADHPPGRVSEGTDHGRESFRVPALRKILGDFTPGRAVDMAGAFLPDFFDHPAGVGFLVPGIEKVIFQG